MVYEITMYGQRKNPTGKFKDTYGVCRSYNIYDCVQPYNAIATAKSYFLADYGFEGNPTRVLVGDYMKNNYRPVDKSLWD